MKHYPKKFGLADRRRRCWSLERKKRNGPGRKKCNGWTWIWAGAENPSVQ